MNAVKNLVIWLLIIAATSMLIDSQRDKLSDRFLSTFLPYKGRIQNSGQNSGSIEFTKSYDGHFYIQALKYTCQVKKKLILPGKSGEKVRAFLK